MYYQVDKIYWLYTKERLEVERIVTHVHVHSAWKKGVNKHGYDMINIKRTCDKNQKIHRNSLFKKVCIYHNLDRLDIS